MCLGVVHECTAKEVSVDRDHVIGSFDLYRKRLNYFGPAGPGVWSAGDDGNRRASNGGDTTGNGNDTTGYRDDTAGNGNDTTGHGNDIRPDRNDIGRDRLGPGGDRSNGRNPGVDSTCSESGPDWKCFVD